MRTLTRKSLDELEKIMPVLSERQQTFIIAGSGSLDPIAWDQFQTHLASGSWGGGYVLDPSGCTTYQGPILKGWYYSGYYIDEDQISIAKYMRLAFKYI